MFRHCLDNLLLLDRIRIHDAGEREREEKEGRKATQNQIDILLQETEKQW